MDAAFYSAVGLGFLLGLKHATEADHVVAVSTIVGRDRSLLRSALVGAFWGVGHTLTLFLVGSVVLIFSFSIPNRFALGMELLVGVMLVALGAQNVVDWLRKQVHAHRHGHDRGDYAHFHSHEQTVAHDHPHQFRFGLKPLLIGMVHGMAGSAALVVLVLSTLDSAVAGAFYILIFGVGSILGMLLMSAVIGLPFVLAVDRFRQADQWIKVAAGAFSILVGLILIGEIGLGGPGLPI